MKTNFYLLNTVNDSKIKAMKQSAEKAEKPKFLTVKMTEKEVDEARAKAEKSGLTLSQVVRKLLQDYAKDPQMSLNF